MKKYNDIKETCQSILDNVLLKSLALIGNIDYTCLSSLESEFNSLEFKQVNYGLIINKKELQNG